MKNFDFYEFTAILVPGTVALLSVVLTVDGASGMLDSPALTVGQFGVLVVLAYVAGHLIQTLGDWVEKAWWRLRGGAPTEWPFRADSPELLSPRFHRAMLATLEKMGYDDLDEIADLPKEEWQTVRRAMQKRVDAAGRAARVDVFNGIYVMHRGLATAFLIAMACEGSRSGDIRWLWMAIAAAGFLLAMHRMDRFARNFARELYLEAVALEPVVTTSPEQGAG